MPPAPPNPIRVQRPSLGVRVWLGFAGALALAVGTGGVLDTAAYHALKHTDAIARDWYQALRQLGSLPVWGVVALILALRDFTAPVRPLRPWASAAHLLLGVLLAGGLAEAFKPIIGRLRPEDTDGLYRFWPLAERYHEWSNIGTFSSHAAVAFAAACFFTRLWPRAGWVLLVLALGTGLTRLLAGGHFFSDVLGGMILGVLGERLAAAAVGVDQREVRA